MHNGDLFSGIEHLIFHEQCLPSRSRWRIVMVPLDQTYVELHSRKELARFMAFQPAANQSDASVH